MENVKKWALEHDECICCKTTERKHRAKGLCGICYDTKKRRARGVLPLGAVSRILQRWSRKHDNCIVCGTVEVRHQGKGMCYHCYGLKQRREKAQRERREKEIRFYFVFLFISFF